jgi:hypothetical protein
MGPALLCHADRHIGTPIGTTDRAPIPPAVMIEGGSEHNVNHSMKQTYENEQGIISPLYPTHVAQYIQQHYIRDA